MLPRVSTPSGGFVPISDGKTPQFKTRPHLRPFNGLGMLAVQAVERYFHLFR